MQIETKAKVHNKFKITVMDAVTNEVKKEVTAYNIVLNEMYKALIDNSGIFSSILVGTGTGVVTPESTQLINRVMTKSVEGKKLNFTNFDGTEFNITGKIIIEAGELVGETITEVAVGTGTDSYSKPQTHAFLKDAEGAIIGITKSATEVLHIEATVYFNISFPDWVTDYVCISASESPFMGNFISAFSAHFLHGGFQGLGLYTAGTIEYLERKNPTVSKDYAAKKVIYKYGRFEAGEANRDIPYFMIGNNKGGLVLKIKERPEGLQKIGDVFLGKGDGMKKSFLLPSKDVKESSVVIKINGQSTGEYQLETKIDKSLIAAQQNESAYHASLSIFNIYEMGNGDFVFLIFSESRRCYLVCIYNSDLKLKQFLTLPRELGLTSLIYISEDFENMVFVRYYNEQIQFIHLAKNSLEADYSVEEDKTISIRGVQHHFLFQKLQGGRDLMIYPTFNQNKIIKLVYDDELKKYTITELSFSIDPSVGTSMLIQLAISDDGTKIYSIYGNKLLEADVTDENLVFNEIATISNNSTFSRGFDCFKFSSNDSSVRCFSPNFIWSKSGATLNIRRISRLDDEKEIKLPSVNDISFFSENPNTAIVYQGNQRIVLEFDEENSVTKKIRDGVLSFKYKAGGLFLQDAHTSYYNSVGKYCCNEHIVHFTTPPPEGAIITASYDGLGITKTENWVIDVSLTISFSEGV